MAVFYSKRKRIYQPQYPAKVNFDKFPTLQSVILPSVGFVDLIKPSVFTPSSVSLSIGPAGKCFLSGPTGPYMTVSGNFCGNQTFSRIAIIRPGSLTGSQTISTTTNIDSVGAAQWFVTSNAIGFNKARSVAMLSATATELAIGTVSVIGISYDGTNISAFIGGRKAGTAVSVQTFTLEATGSMFSRSGGTESMVSGDIYLHADFVGALLDAQMISLTNNPYQLFKSEKRQIWIPVTSSGATTLSTTSQPWSWAGNSAVIQNNLNTTTPQPWSWVGITAQLTENLATNPTTWAWAGLTATITEGSAVTLNTTPTTWAWQGINATVYEKVDTTPTTWSWAGGSASVSNLLDTIPGTWAWAGLTAQILGKDVVDTNAQTWSWVGGTATLTLVVPEQTNATIGGKKAKKVNLPYYDKADIYDSKIEIEESARDDNRVVADLLDVRGDVIRKPDSGIGKPAVLDVVTTQQAGSTITDLVKGLAPKVTEVPVEFPQVVESVDESFDEESAVIMLLLAA